MKKKVIQKFLTAALSTAMAFSMLAGCGSEPAGNSNESGSTPQQSSQDNQGGGDSQDSQASAPEGGSASGAAGVEGFTAFADNVTLKIPVYDRGQAGIPDVKDNYWTKWVQENFGDKYNITVQYIPIGRQQVMQDVLICEKRR